MNGVLFGHDEAVAGWVFHTYKIRPMQCNMAIGLISPEGQLRGGVLFQNYNGCNVDFSYYGTNTMTLGIMRTMARVALHTFDPSRVTVNTSKKNRALIHFLGIMGCRFEGIARCFYGRDDSVRNTAMRFVMFRDRLERLAGLPRKVETCLVHPRPDTTPQPLTARADPYQIRARKELLS